MKFLTVSFVKNYNKEKQFNTSDRIFTKLDNLVAALLDTAHINAAKDGRKTIMDRDIDSALENVMSVLIEKNKELKDKIEELENRINYLENP